jgi:hypothetical protein
MLKTLIIFIIIILIANFLIDIIFGSNYINIFLNKVENLKLYSTVDKCMKLSGKDESYCKMASIKNKKPVKSITLK